MQEPPSVNGGAAMLQGRSPELEQASPWDEFGVLRALKCRRESRQSRLEAARLSAAEGQLTVAQAFDELLSDLELSDAVRVAASEQQQRFRDRISAHLTLKATYLTGSYRRRTQIPPCDDIDLIALLDEHAYPELMMRTPQGARLALDWTEAALRKAYPKSEIKRYARCVQIMFSNSGIGFDVVPALQFTPHEFWIPDAERGRWLRINPKEQQRLLSEANQRVGGMLVPAVKLLKAWADAHDVPLRGFTLEAAAYYVMQFTPATHRQGLPMLFGRIADLLDHGGVPDIWPAGEPADHDLSYADRVRAVSSLRMAKQRADEALAAEERGEICEAHAAWYELFGDRYPEAGAEPASRVVTMSKPMAAMAAVAAISGGHRISATHAGLVPVAPGLVSAKSPTDHGGDEDTDRPTQVGTESSPRILAGELLDEQAERLERAIERTQRQFLTYERLEPAKAAADPKLWPVTKANCDQLYAVLIGVQRTNLGGRHRVLVMIPLNMPAQAPRAYLIGERETMVVTAKGWRRKRPRRHRWRDGSLCTNSLRDHWDGRLITALIFVADYLVRYDYYQITGQWIGREITPTGALRINDKIGRAAARARRGGSR